MGYIRLEKDAENIVELILDQPDKAVNTMGEEFIEAMTNAVADLEQQIAADPDSVKGVYLRSGKPTFFGGGDLNSKTSSDQLEEQARFIARIYILQRLKRHFFLGQNCRR